MGRAKRNPSTSRAGRWVSLALNPSYALHLPRLVIASQRVRASRGPMTGSVKQSMSPQAEIWIASSLSLLAMTKDTPPPSRSTKMPERCIASRPSKSRGRRECRMLAAPAGPCVQRKCTLRTQATTGQPGQPAFPARWFTAYTRSPRCALLFSHRRFPGSSPAKLDSSIGESGPRDFARP